MDSELILRIEQIIIATAAIVGLGFTVLKWIVPAGVRIHGSIKKIDTIYAEVKPNGGASLRDSIDRQEAALGEVRDGLDMADARQWAILSSTNHPTWESGPDGGCLRANAALLDLVGRSADQMAGNGWENIVAKEDARRVWKEWAEAVKQRRAFESTYRVVNHVTGGEFLIDGRATPILGRNGALRGWIGVYNNVRPVKAPAS